MVSPCLCPVKPSGLSQYRIHPGRRCLNYDRWCRYTYRRPLSRFLRAGDVARVWASAVFNEMNGTVILSLVERFVPNI